MVQILTQAGADVTIPAYSTDASGNEDTIHPVAICLLSALTSGVVGATVLDLIRHLIQRGANVQIQGHIIYLLAVKSAKSPDSQAHQILKLITNAGAVFDMSQKLPATNDSKVINLLQ